MRGMWEHVDGLHATDAVVLSEHFKVAGLRGRIARHVYDALWSCIHNGFNDVGMHAGTGWVGDDHVRPAMPCDELIGQDVLHVACIEQGVVDVVQSRVDLGILNGLGNVFYADDLMGHAGHEIGNGACSCVEVVDEGQVG